MTTTPKPLTPKQEAFCQHYAIHADAYKAYKVAYNAHNTDVGGTKANACNLLKNPRVAQRIADLQGRTKRIASEAVEMMTSPAVADRRLPVEESNLAFDISAEKVLQELAVIGFSNIADYVRVDADGIPMPDFSAVTRRQFAAIGEVTYEDIETGQRTGKRVKFKLLDKKGALVDLGRHLGLFKDDRTVNVNVHADAATTFDSRLAALAARAIAEEVSRLPHGEGTSGTELSLELLGQAGADRARSN